MTGLPRMQAPVPLRFAALGLLVFAASIAAMVRPQVNAAPAPVVFPGAHWAHVDPAKAGWSVAKLKEAEDYARTIGSTAVFVVQDGNVIATFGDVDRKLYIHSVRKSFMSALYGIAVANHKIDLGKSLAQLGIDDKPPSLTAKEKQATVRQLLMARSGVYHKASNESEPQADKRPARGSHAPGTFWYYNNWDFNALGTILRQATGEDTFAAVSEQLAKPLEMEDFVPADGHDSFIEESEHPAYVMQFTARDLARFGWLYLNHGRWRDHQVVPAAWVAESTKPYSQTDGSVYYGYLWWVAPREKLFQTELGPGAFSARGLGGQFIVVAPAHRLVVVHLNEHFSKTPISVGTFSMLMQDIFAAAPRRW
jgi:CubicO group peptidase (beta-lactamase class C family)